jgi:hypothetical protein
MKRLLVAALLGVLLALSGSADSGNWNIGGVLKSSVPVMGACGTSPTVSGTDNNIKVVVGTGGTATSCAVTFGSVFATAPACVTVNDTDRVSYNVVTTVSTVTVTATAAITASSKLHILCFGS